MKTVKDLLKNTPSQVDDSRIDETVSSFDGLRTTKPKSLNLNKVPSLITFRRQSMRQFPDQVIALYYSSQIDRHLTIPFGGMNQLSLGEELELDERYRNPGNSISYALGYGTGKAIRGAAGLLKKGKAPEKDAEPEPTSKKTVDDTPTNTTQNVKKSISSKKKVMKAKTKVNSAKSGELEISGGPIGTLHPNVSATAGTEGGFDGAMRTTKVNNQNTPKMAPQKKYKRKLAGKPKTQSMSYSASGNFVKPTKKQVNETFKRRLAEKRGEQVDENVGALIGGAVKSVGGMAAKLGSGLWKGAKKVGSAALNMATSDAENPGNPTKVNISKVKSYKAVTKKNSSKKNMGLAIADVQAIKDLKSLSESDTKISQAWQIGEDVIKINKNMAKKIVGLYESINDENKQIMLEMLTKDGDSFKKVANFALRY
jgi:hypothetical protein